MEVLIGGAAMAGRAASSGGLLPSAKSAGRMLGLGIAALTLPEDCASEIDSVLAAGSRLGRGSRLGDGHGRLVAPRVRALTLHHCRRPHRCRLLRRRYLRRRPLRRRLLRCRYLRRRLLRRRLLRRRLLRRRLPLCRPLSWDYSATLALLARCCGLRWPSLLWLLVSRYRLPGRTT